MTSTQGNGSATVQIVECAPDDERQYPGAAAAQPAYIELDLRRGILLADNEGDPDEEFFGFKRRYAISTLTGEMANQVMAQIAALAERILGDWSESFDGSNVVAALGADAQNAETEIQECLDPDRLVVYWDLDKALAGDEVAQWGITAETTDDCLYQIEEYMVGSLAAEDNGVVVCPGLGKHLRRLRGDLNHA